jgi:hypothetical protein
VGDVASDAIEQIVFDIHDAGIKEGQERQKESDVNAAVKILFDLQVKEHEIYSYINKYFKNVSITEVEQDIKGVKISRKICDLRKLYESEGMSEIEFRIFIKRNNIKILLKDDNYLKMQPEKLKKYIDSNISK